jgi:hypothetical protein
MQFDYPDANVHAERRAYTTTPTQKLFLLNNPFVLARASTLQKKAPGKDDNARTTALYLALFGRTPEKSELYTAGEFLSHPTDSKFTRWDQLTQALLASNEFMYVD